MKLEELPIVNWPGESNEYKMVQIEIGGKPYIILESIELKEDLERKGKRLFHRNILEFLFTQLGREYPTIPTPKEDGFMPALTSEWYKVVGMGSCFVNCDKKEAHFDLGSASGDYGSRVNKEHVSSVSKLVSDWKMFTAVGWI